jgi:hypothetical protein
VGYTYLTKQAPIRATSIPRHPDAARINKSPQAEATTCRDPGSVDCPGVLFCGGQSIFSSSADFPGVCVVAATLRVYSHPGSAMDGTDDVVSD